MNKDDKLFQFPQVYTVEASAGSGKTYALAKRYVWLLMGTEFNSASAFVPLNTILAITFTNKAALEMKERILEFLKKIALDKFTSSKERDEILSSLGVKQDFARKRAQAIMDQLITNYNFFQVQTIDSFINAILSGCAFKLGLSASFKTEKNFLDYLGYSLDKLIERASYDKEVLELFHNFLFQYIYLENKAGWFPKQDILSIIISLYSENNKYAGAFIRSSTDSKDLMSSKKEMLKDMTELYNTLPDQTHKSFAGSLSSFVEKYRETFDVDELSAFFKREEFPVRKDGEIPGTIASLWKKIRQGLKEICEKESLSVFNYYIDIFNRTLCGLREICAKDDVLFLESLNKEARSLFNEKSLSLPELYYRLAARYRHFLLDEFQDTSRLQWDNLFSMIEEALSTGGSLFYVGDKKQAIYRFRGGQVSLIDSVRERFYGSNIIRETLDKNYRSCGEIVEFNNSSFCEANLRKFLSRIQESGKHAFEFEPEDIDAIVKIFESAGQSCASQKEEGYVKIEPLNYKTSREKQQAVKQKVTALVRDLNSRFPLKDIAILVRKNDEVQLLTSCLLEEGIPVESESTLDIRQNPYIKELVSFLKFLESPIDNLSFASFILGDIFRCACGLTEEQTQAFLFKLRDSKESAYFYKEFRALFPAVWEELIEFFFKSVGFIPLYELVVGILGKFKVPAKFPDYQGVFMRFLELVKEREDEGAGISAFLEFFESAGKDDLYVHSAESESVKIITIHKSKGLEFPVVIIPFLEINVKVDSNLVVCDDTGLKLIYIKKKYADYSFSLKQIYKDEYLKSFIDELNSIYVAFTRPEKELYIFVSDKCEKGFNVAGLLLPENNLERGRKSEKPLPPSGGKGRGETAVDIPVSEYKDWIYRLKDEFAGENTLEGREKILKGEIFHYILSCIDNLYKKNTKEVIKSAIEKSRVKFSFIKDFSPFEKGINELLNNERIRPYFEIKDALIYPEVEIVDSNGDTKRIDRLIIKRQEALVLDYKSTKASKELYYSQISEYAGIIKNIYPDLRVRGVLLYLDDFSLEEAGRDGADKNIQLIGKPNP